jgi:hypothetical protein
MERSAGGRVHWERKQRWRIVALLILVLPVGFWLTSVNRQLASVKTIVQNGGGVYFSYQEPFEASRPLANGGILGFSDLTPFVWSVKAVLLVDPIDSEIDSLRGLKKLRAVRVVHASDGDLRALGNVVRIESLHVTGNVTDDGISGLTKMSRLRFLAIDSDLVTDEGIRVLSELHGLRQLELTSASVTREEVKNLRARLADCEVRVFRDRLLLRRPL